MMFNKAIPFIFLSTLFFSASSFATTYEDKIKSILFDNLILLSSTQDINIEEVNSENAREYKVYYSPEDHDNFNMLSGIKKRIIKELVNEVSISLQKKKAVQEGKDFSYKTRKVHIVSFHNRGPQK